MSATVKTRSWLVVVVPWLLAAAPPPPAALARYVHDGRFDPGDYHWLRGAFVGANAAEVAAHRAIVDWRRRCRASDMAETRKELEQLGVEAGASLETIPYRSLVCDQVASLPEPLDLRDWAGFVRDVATVRPIVQGYLAAVAEAEGGAVLQNAELRDTLNLKPTGEQALRSGLAWAKGSASSARPAPVLTPRQQGILVAEFAIALAARDHANTAWLKTVVATQGWPERSRVGESAARATWLLVQHADADPAFQIRSLRLMQPLVAADEVDRRKYAYLYDRVMLKTAGRQRFGTQLTCREGRYAPLPVDDAGSVNARRREVGLETLEEYEAKALHDMGSCQGGPGLP